MQTLTLSTLVGTMGGTALTMADVHGEDIFKAMLLSMVGAISGFVTSALLAWLTRKFRNRNKEQ